MVGTRKYPDTRHPVTLQYLGTGIRNMGEVEDMRQEWDRAWWQGDGEHMRIPVGVGQGSGTGASEDHS